jgi:hypothetical protein
MAVEEKTVIITALLAPAVILGSIALIKGYAIKVWIDRKDDPDHKDES